MSRLLFAIVIEQEACENRVLWYRGGDGPSSGGGWACTPPDPSDPNYLGLSVRFAITRVFSPTDCRVSGSTSTDFFFAGLTDTNFEVEIINRSGPCNAGQISWSGADTGATFSGFKVFLSASYTEQLIPGSDPGSDPSDSGYYYEYDSGGPNQNCSEVPGQTNEEWLAEQDWQSRTYAVEIIASFANETLTVRDAATSAVLDQIPLQVAEFELACIGDPAPA
jgi:hypothetical protein